MAQPHISKEELRHDVFRDSMFEGIDFLYKHLKIVIASVVAVVVIAAAVIGYYAYSQQVAQQQSAAFSAAEKILGQPGLTKEERMKQTDAALTAFLKDNPNSRLAPAAYVYIARFAVEVKDYAKADANYQKALADSHLDPVQRTIVLLSLGKVRIAQGKPAEAQAFFDQVTDKRFEDAKAYSIGTADLAAGKPADARKQFQIASTAQPNSSITGWAKDALDYLP